MKVYQNCDELAYRTSLVIEQDIEGMNKDQRFAYLVILKRRLFDKISELELTSDEMNNVRNNIATFLNQL